MVWNGGDILLQPNCGFLVAPLFIHCGNSCDLNPHYNCGLLLLWVDQRSQYSGVCNLESFLVHFELHINHEYTVDTNYKGSKMIYQNKKK